MDFFNGKIDAQITPASIQFFAIIDPTLSHNEDDSIDQILLFLTSDGLKDDNDKLRKVGIIQGINSLVQNFEGSDELRYIELDNQLIIFDTFEDHYQIMISLNLTQIKDEGLVEHISHDIAPVQFIKEIIHQGYSDFRLHNGSISSNSSNEEFQNILSKWWSIWFTSLQLDLIENGTLKLYKGFKVANYNPQPISFPHQLTNFYIFNTSKVNYETYGLLHDHKESLTTESKTRLLNWIEEQDSYNITAQSLVLPQVLKTTKLPQSSSTGEIVYDPFKLVFYTLSDVAKISGVTAGVNAGVAGVSSGLSTINGYLPSWMGGKAAAETEQAVQRGEDVQGDRETGQNSYEFLIGKLNNGDVLKKEVWLQLKDEDTEKKFRIIVFKYFDLLFIGVYENDNQLDNPEIYGELEQEFIRIGDSIKVDEAKEKNFYFVIYNQFEHSIESNLPNIPKYDDEEVNDLKYFHDLSKSQTQSKILHREIIKMIEVKTNELEKLKRTKNGWWIYKLNHQDKEILIVKKWQILSKNGSGGDGSIRSKILDNSTSILGSIGKDAKLWLEDYLTKNKI